MNDRRPLVYLLICLILFGFGVALGQSPPSITISPETIAACEGRIILDSAWRYHEGDNSQWADPAFDDSDWVTRPSTIFYRHRVPETAAGYGWYRVRLLVDSSLYNRTLAIGVSALGEAEIFLNGEPILTVGMPSDATASEEDLRQRHMSPRSLSLSDQPEQVVAVRFKSFELSILREMGGRTGFSMRLGYFTETMDNFVRSLVYNRGLQMFLTGIALAYFLSHLLMFLYYRKARENLYYAIFTLGFAGLAYLPIQFATAPTASSIAVLTTLSKISIILVCVAGLKVLNTIFARKLKKPHYVFPIIGLVLLPGAVVVPFEVYYLFGTISIVEMIRITIVAVREKKEYARVIGGGFVVFALSSGYSLVGFLHVFTLAEEQSPHYMLGFLAVMIAMSFYLARNFAKTHRSLDKAAELRKAHLELEAAYADLGRAHRELKTTQSQLAQSEKMASLGQLVAGVAHEINNPIGAISSMHDTLTKAVAKLKRCIEDGCDVDCAAQTDLDRLMGVIDNANRVISDGTDRVTNIVKRLRSFARLDEAELKEADLNEGLEDTLTLIHHQLKHEITVVKEFGEIPRIECYPGQLNQVFLNLLVNARQAIDGRGTIRVATHKENDRVIIEIEDSGRGIAPENLERVFDPGFTTKGVGIGTGLGLSICYQIIQDHRGEIRASSEAGKGTTFTISLPRVRKN